MNLFRKLLDYLRPKRTPPPCQHPEDRRINFTAMGVTHWKCRDCGYEFYRRKGGD